MKTQLEFIQTKIKDNLIRIYRDKNKYFFYPFKKKNYYFWTLKSNFLLVYMIDYNYTFKLKIFYDNKIFFVSTFF